MRILLIHSFLFYLFLNAKSIRPIRYQELVYTSDQTDLAKLKEIFKLIDKFYKINSKFLVQLNECNLKVNKKELSLPTGYDQVVLNAQAHLNDYLKSEIERNYQKIDELESKLAALNISYVNSKSKSPPTSDQEKPEMDCSSLKGNGVIQIEISGKSGTVEKPIIVSVFCENKWLIIQQRVNGFETSFNRTWYEYANGFGSLKNDFWLGLEMIHRFTNRYQTELVIEIVDWSDKVFIAKYESFQVGSEQEFYRLDLSTQYQGNASKDYLDDLYFGLSSQNGAYFSSYDKLNYDHSSYSKQPKNCAARSGGGWWFNNFMNCLPVNLNGIYVSGASAPSAKGIKWQAIKPFDKNYALKKSRMKIRPRL